MNISTSAVSLPSGRRGIAVAGVLVGGVSLTPLFTSEFTIFLLSRAFILASLAVSFNLIFGFANMPSFGHAAFYGLGAYSFAIALEQLALPAAAVVAVFAALLYGVFVGIVSTRGHGIYFALLTFAFAQVLYEAFIRFTDLTGGQNGIIVGSIEVYGFSTADPMVPFYLSLGLLCVILLFGHRLLNSPLGKVMRAIRDNPQRAKAVGYPVRRVRIFVFALSAVLSSLAGIVFILNSRFVSPEALHYNTSIELVIVSIIGGTTTLLGPVLGAGFLIGVEEFARGFTELNVIIVGILFILVVIYAPEGLYGQFKK